MSALIRNGTPPSSPQWRAPAASREAPPPNPVAERLEEENGAHRQTIKDLIAKHEAELKRTRHQAIQETEERLAHLKADAEAALDNLKCEALQRLDSKLNGLDALALLFCETALEKVFVGPADYRDLMTRAIAKQCEALRAELIVRMVVSARDFDETNVAILRQHSALSRCEVKLDDTMERGACRIELTLGQIDLSLPEYWYKLQGRFRALAVDAKP